MTPYHAAALPHEFEGGGQTAVETHVPSLHISSSHVSSTPPPRTTTEKGRYEIRVAQSLAERESACRLRFKVFNIELGEGLSSSYSTGMDQDAFDLFCDHLIVTDRMHGEVVGTYRMQSGAMALRNIGYYSDQEFDLSPFEPVRDQLLELGRASIDREHRTSEVLNLLWRAIATYARSHGLRYLIGCSSLNSEVPATGWSVYEQLIPFLAPGPFLTQPREEYMLPQAAAPSEIQEKVPRLLRAYIGVGARICSTPAWDREFRTIDFLTLLDLENLSPAARNRFLGEEA
ncbi:GNAT family N-acetyltransferase [Silvibacterium sp.]|uniref:GNAT family N-acetyltransferase n=1 Tax=Silvibacterium sp. TaxID=1964179 RepID=UPI0039E22E96